MIYFKTIDEAYKKACLDLLKYGKEVRGTKELNNYTFTISDITKNIVNVRNISKSYLLGEHLWYVCGRNDIKFIQQFAGLWGRISDDGVTSNSAYGDIIFKRHGFDQVEEVIKLLKIDKDSRRAVINLNVPNQNMITTKDEICTIALQFLIRDNKLDCTCIMRSNDIWYGLPYDCAFFMELQKYIAKRLNVKYGKYTHFAVSLHVYKKDYKNIEKCIHRNPKTNIALDFSKLLKNKKLLEKEMLKENIDAKKEIVEICEKLGIIKEEQIC